MSNPDPKNAANKAGTSPQDAVGASGPLDYPEVRLDEHERACEYCSLKLGERCGRGDELEYAAKRRSVFQGATVTVTLGKGKED
jgi:hypothetical protein